MCNNVNYRCLKFLDKKSEDACKILSVLIFIIIFYSNFNFNIISSILIEFVFFTKNLRIFKNLLFKKIRNYIILYKLLIIIFKVKKFAYE